jgi:hypothetical protein
LQETQQLCDQLEAEYRETLEEVQARAAEHGEELREWHADDRMTSSGVDVVGAIDAVEAFDPFDPVDAPADEATP